MTTQWLNHPDDHAMNINDIRTNIPGYQIYLDVDDFVYVARPTLEGGPIFRGTAQKCIKAVASEQGWSEGQIAATLAYYEEH